jgi:GNAT superfamily N-acetyltransferase
MQFEEIHTIDSKEFNDAMEIYTEAFPASERHSLAVISQRVRDGLSKLYVGTSNGEISFLALLWPLKTTEFILLDYIATKANQRGKGIASAFLMQLREKLRNTNNYLIIEVENSKFGDKREEKEKRVTFYKRHGAKELEGIRYLLPPLDGTTPTEMILMIFPEYRSEDLDGAALKKVIVQIYRELYDRSDDDALLGTFVHDIGGRIKLI